MSDELFIAFLKWNLEFMRRIGRGSSRSEQFQLPPIVPGTPTIISFTPSSADVGTDEVVITGTDFYDVTSVTVNGVAATNFRRDSPTQITLRVPAGAATGAIAVNTLHGSVASGSNLTVPAATITSVSPNNGFVGDNIVITGTNFLGATDVTFNGISVDNFEANNDAQDTVPDGTEITCVVPSSATTGDVVVVAPHGNATSPSAFTVDTPPATPTISGFTPTSGLIGSTTTIDGTNFTNVNWVRFGGVSGVDASYVVNSSIEIDATVPVGADTGAISINTAGGTVTSGSNFTVNTPPPNPPDITSFAPTNGPINTQVVITGSSFTNATTVEFNGTNAAFFVDSDTQITTNVPDGATTGTITVTSAGGADTSAGSFTVDAPTGAPIPSLSTWESNMIAGAGTNGGSFQADESLIISHGLWEGGVWYYDGAYNFFRIYDYTGTDVYRQAAGWVLDHTYRPYTALGATGWRVFPEGLKQDVLRNGNTASATAIADLATKSAFWFAGGGTDTDLSRETAYILNAYRVHQEINGVDQTSQMSVSLDFALGHLNAWSTNTGTTLKPFMVGLTLDALIDYYEDVTADSRIPTAITTMLDYLRETAVLQTDGVTPMYDAASQSYYFIDRDSAPDGGLAVITPAPKLNLLLVRAFAWALNHTGNQKYLQYGDEIFEGGVDDASTNGFFSGKEFSQNYFRSFDYINLRQGVTPSAPTITSFAPTSGYVGFPVVVTGTGFEATSTVDFNSTLSTAVSVPTPTSITAEVPTGATTGAITVTNSNGSDTSVTNFTVTAAPAPTISFFLPANDIIGAAISITGTGFYGATNVQFNGTSATYQIDSETQITAIVPSGATDGVISVVTPGGTANSANSFTVDATAAFDPRNHVSASSRVVGWYDFSDNSVCLDSGASACDDAEKIDTVTDKSDSSFDATQTVDADRPTYRLNQQNSLSAADFDGTGVRFHMGSSRGIARDVGGFTVVYACRVDKTGNCSVFDMKNGTGGDRIGPSHQYLTPDHSWRIAGTRLDADSLQQDFSSAATPLTEATWGIHVWEYDYTNAEYTIYSHRGTELATVAFQTAGNTSDTDSNADPTIGANSVFGGNPFEGLIGEVVLVDEVLSESNRTGMVAGLGDKWGITVS